MNEAYRSAYKKEATFIFETVRMNGNSQTGRRADADVEGNDYAYGRLTLCRSYRLFSRRLVHRPSDAMTHVAGSQSSSGGMMYP